MLRAFVLHRSERSFSVHDTDVAMMEDEHDIALLVLAELAWCHRQACEWLSMHACMIHMLATRRFAPHDALMCSQQGRSKAVELAYNGYEWLYKSRAVAFDGSACRGAMASIVLPHVSTENDRKINLSQRVLSMRCERSISASL